MLCKKKQKSDVLITDKIYQFFLSWSIKSKRALAFLTRCVFAQPSSTDVFPNVFAKACIAIGNAPGHLLACLLGELRSLLSDFRSYKFFGYWL